MDYDPIPILSAVQCPLLVVVPEHDMQVPPEDGQAICSRVAGPCDNVIVPRLSHILRDDPESKGPTAYRRALKGPVSPVVLETISNWVAEQLSSPRASSDEANMQ
jgi:hypothetical protein